MVKSKISDKKSLIIYEMKSRKNVLTEPEIVNDYMSKLQHPLKAEMEAVRIIIKNANSKIAERIKWNAPSYYYKEDLVTFNHRATKHVHLVFHHHAIINIKSDLLKGDYKDRRMIYFININDIELKEKELERIMNEMVEFINNQ